ncbi:MAG TPA: ROK family protein, partial [Actinomycetota bacterium]|nr:ROK family protein [Actinomycetota bacterium]
MICAIDCGGTRIKAAAVDEDGSPVGEVRTAAAEGEPVEAILAVAREVAPGCDAVGLCVPGLVDERGVIVSLPGKLEGIVGVDLPAVLQDGLGLPATVVNDAVAYGVGEAVHGAAAGSAAAPWT